MTDGMVACKPATHRLVRAHRVPRVALPALPHQQES